jgi:hypothetical protein
MMDKELRNLTFEGWVKHVFDHPVGEPEWHFDIDAEWWNSTASPNVTVEYLTRLFENAPTLLTSFTDAQLNQGFWFLVGGSSSHMFALIDESVPWVDHKRCIQSFNTLFEQFFAPKCSPHLSHLDEPNASPLNLVCYMWWDIIPFYGKAEEPARRRMDDDLLKVMERTLELDSDACRESALHGLGHWKWKYSDFVQTTIDRFLKNHPELRPELEAYARRARSGRVL